MATATVPRFRPPAYDPRRSMGLVGAEFMRRRGEWGLVGRNAHHAWERIAVQLGPLHRSTNQLDMAKGYGKIAEAAGCCARTVQRFMDYLAAKELIVKQSGGGKVVDWRGRLQERANVYRPAQDLWKVGKKAAERAQQVAGGLSDNMEAQIARHVRRQERPDTTAQIERATRPVDEQEDREAPPTSWGASSVGSVLDGTAAAILRPRRGPPTRGE